MFWVSSLSSLVSAAVLCLWKISNRLVTQSIIWVGMSNKVLYLTMSWHEVVLFVKKLVISFVSCIHIIFCGKRKYKCKLTDLSLSVKGKHSIMSVVCVKGLLTQCLRLDVLLSVGIFLHQFW